MGPTGMTLRRRSVCSLAGVTAVAGISGCLSRLTAGTGRLAISSSHPEEQPLQIRIAPEYDADSVFTETITVAETDHRVEREAVVTGRRGSTFFVEINRMQGGETYETTWELSCAGTDDRDDLLHVIVTESGTVQFSQHRCGSTIEDPPPAND